MTKHDNRELAEKWMDAKDMEYEMSRQGQSEMDAILEEIHNENQSNIEQLQSDLEDAKNEIKQCRNEITLLKTLIKNYDDTGVPKSNKLCD